MALNCDVNFPKPLNLSRRRELKKQGFFLIIVGSVFVLVGGPVCALILTENYHSVLIISVFLTSVGLIMTIVGGITLCKLKKFFGKRFVLKQTAKRKDILSKSEQRKESADKTNEAIGGLDFIVLPWPGSSENGSGSSITGLEPQIFPLIRSGWKVLYVPQEVIHQVGSS